MENPVGKTKDVGFEFGTRKMFPVSTEKVWDFFSESGLKIWLGNLKVVTHMLLLMNVI